jgi:putative restriction endonuclease
MRWLDDRNKSRVDFAWLSQFECDGERVALMDRQRGIRKPAGMSAALAIRTTYTAPTAMPPYADEIGADGLQRYKFRGTDPQHPENVALRRAQNNNFR